LAAPTRWSEAPDRGLDRRWRSAHAQHTTLIRRASAHLVESERLLAGLPLVEKRHRDHHLQLALVNAVLSIAASILGSGQTKPKEPETEETR